MRFGRLLWRSLRLRCPVCGEGTLFRGLFTTYEVCPVCSTRFEREPGFYLGSIYINYGLTSLAVAVAYPVLLFGGWVGERKLLLGSLAFVLLFPLLFFRHARSLWIGFDQFYDPRPEPER